MGCLQVPPDCLQLQARMTPRPSLSDIHCPDPEDVARLTEEMQAQARADACATRQLVACTFHAKSKYVSGGERKWRSHNDADKQEYIRASVSKPLLSLSRGLNGRCQVRNRRRIIGECLRLRDCLNRYCITFYFQLYRLNRAASYAALCLSKNHTHCW
jgi:hypothetical protein